MADTPDKTTSSNPANQSLPEKLAAEAGMPRGGEQPSNLMPPSSRDAQKSANHDPHSKAQDFSLRPDASGSRDPVVTLNTDPHARSADHGLRADPAGARDPLPGAAANAFDAASSRVENLGDKVRDSASSLADAAQDRLRSATEGARNQASGVYGDAREWVSDLHTSQRRRAEQLAARGQERWQGGRTAVEEFVSENPLLVGVVGVAAGLLIGALLPRTRSEDRNLGPWADEVRDQGLRYARDFTARGREFVENALDPDNLNAAGQRSDPESDPEYRGKERTAHRL